MKVDGAGCLEDRRPFKCVALKDSPSFHQTLYTNENASPSMGMTPSGDVLDNPEIKGSTSLKLGEKTRDMA